MSIRRSPPASCKTRGGRNHEKVLVTVWVKKDKGLDQG